jgi:hypothetical protein
MNEENSTDRKNRAGSASDGGSSEFGCGQPDVGHETAPSSADTMKTLGDLSPGSLVDQIALARALGVSTRTVRRMVDRYELPPGIQMGARKMWFADKVVAFLSDRADGEARQARSRRRKLDEMF